MYAVDNDISPNWKGSSAYERFAIDRILEFEGTGEAILKFYRYKGVLDEYWYWFILSNLWVSYSGSSDLNLWKKLFSSGRKGRGISIMKPSELKVFRTLPNRINAYRAHRPGETDWISYTLDRQLAERWVEQRGGYLAEYELRKKDCIALFLRRGEQEVLMLNPKQAKLINSETAVIEG